MLHKLLGTIPGFASATSQPLPSSKSESKAPKHSHAAQPAKTPHPRKTQLKHDQFQQSRKELDSSSPQKEPSDKASVAEYFSFPRVREWDDNKADVSDGFYSFPKVKEWPDYGDEASQLLSSSTNESELANSTSQEPGSLVEDTPNGQTGSSWRLLDIFQTPLNWLLKQNICPLMHHQAS